MIRNDTYLNLNNENKIAKPIKNYLDLFINTSLNHISIRSRLVNQPNIKLKLNSEQLFNATDLSPITFGLIFPPKLRDKSQQILKLIRQLRMRRKALKYVLSKYY